MPHKDFVIEVVMDETKNAVESISETMECEPTPLPQPHDIDNVNCNVTNIITVNEPNQNNTINNTMEDIKHDHTPIEENAEEEDDDDDDDDDDEEGEEDEKDSNMENDNDDQDDDDQTGNDENFTYEKIEVVKALCSLCMVYHPKSLLKNGHTLKAPKSNFPLSKVLALSVQVTLRLPKRTWPLCPGCIDTLETADVFITELNNWRAKMTNMKKKLSHFLHKKVRAQDTGMILSSPIQLLRPQGTLQNRPPPSQNIESRPNFPMMRPPRPVIPHKIMTDLRPLPNSPMANAQKKKPIICPLCRKSVKLIKEHIKNKHKKKVKVICRLCVKQYPTEADLANHMLYRHEEDTKLEDLLANCDIESAISLRRKKGKVPRKPCPVCGVVLQKHYLTIHMRHHDQNYRLPCKLCPETFRRRQHRLLHMRRVHGQPGPKPRPLKVLTCPICSKVYRGEILLKRHLNNVHAESKELYKCRQCDKLFKTKFRLKSHLVVHTDQRPYMCELCNKRFKISSTVRKHLRKVHKLEIKHSINDPNYGNTIPLVKLFNPSLDQFEYTVVENASATQTVGIQDVQTTQQVM